MRASKRRSQHRWLILSLLVGLVVGIAAYASYDHFYLKPQIEAKEERTRRKYETELNRHRAVEQRLQNETRTATSATDKLMQPVNQAEAKPFMRILEANHFSGTALMIRRGKIILNTGLGYADAESGRLNGPETLYQIGSIQKGLTAVLLMRLVEQGKVHLSDPISKYLTGIRTGKQVTLRMMLNMRSGLSLTRAQSASLSDAGIVRWSIANLNYGTVRYDYQPVNYVLLAGVIEKVTGRLYADLIQQEIFKKLKLTHSGFMPELFHESNQAFGYSGPINNPYAKRYTEPSVNYNRELGTGNIYTSAGDLYQIIKAVNQGKIISTASLKALRNLDNGQYTAGVYNFGGYTLTHGVVASQSAGTMIDTSGQNAVVLLANTDKITQSLIKNLYLNMIKGV